MLYSSAINMMAMLCSFEMYLRIITGRKDTTLLTTELTEKANCSQITVWKL
jgi:hypothetical protein